MSREHILGQTAMITRQDMESHVENKLSSFRALIFAVLALFGAMVAGQYYIGTQVGGLQANVQNLEKSVDKLAQQMADNQRASNERFDKLAERIDQTNSRLDKLIDATNRKK